mmetsp:Transcript_13816/g.38992  ORF Transcript_13816/g.38992 Transcript_13816/m.38992 type:complete len:274 (-) Transcript_13816:6-827(-)
MHHLQMSRFLLASYSVSDYGHGIYAATSYKVCVKNAFCKIIEIILVPEPHEDPDLLFIFDCYAERELLDSVFLHPRLMLFHLLPHARNSGCCFPCGVAPNDHEVVKALVPVLALPEDGEEVLWDARHEAQRGPVRATRGELLGKNLLDHRRLDERVHLVPAGKPKVDSVGEVPEALGRAQQPASYLLLEARSCRGANDSSGLVLERPNVLHALPRVLGLHLLGIYSKKDELLHHALLLPLATTTTTTDSRDLHPHLGCLRLQPRSRRPPRGPS